jgi:signal transduction histidine kinase
MDAVLAAALLVVGESQVWLGWNDGGVGVAPPGDKLARALLVVGLVAPLAWRRVRPLLVVGVVCGAIVVQLVVVAPYVPFLAGLLPMAVANYSAAAYAPRWPAGSLALMLATETVIYATIPEERNGGEVLFALFVVLGTWVAGDVVRHRVTRADETMQAARLVVAERDAAAAAALTEERARIARELHDVIAHSVSVMGVQAGAARTLMDTDAPAARAALLSVEATARSSVTELQRLLAVLRDGDDVIQDRDPAPGLAAVPALLERMRDAGLPVDLCTTAQVSLPAGVDLAAYRIIQEALTNALKHSGAPTVVTVDPSPGELRIQIRDVGSARTQAATTYAGGHGLVGMRERAHLYGGTIDAGPHPDGGFVVVARLPLDEDRGT